MKLNPVSVTKSINDLFDFYMHPNRYTYVSNCHDNLITEMMTFNISTNLSYGKLP